MNEILGLNVLAMYFVYGLSFFTMGIAIALQYRSYSSFRMANSLSLLAAFALLHGFSEWGSLFMPVRIPDFGEFPMWKLIAIQRLLQSVSYFFLFCFGVKLISDTRRQNFFMALILPTVAFLIWFSQFARFIPLVGTEGLIEWLLVSESWSRYLLAFPASLFTAYGLYLQIPEVSKIIDRAILRNLWIATVVFVMYAFFGGLVVSHDVVGGLGKLINARNFLHISGLPIELFRTGTALLATWSITRMLAIFDLEKQRQVLESRRLEVVYRERERFARDLHDDVIQSIYAVGLDMQTTNHLIGKDNERAAGQINSSIERLNKVIHTLRAYIRGLETKGREQDLKASLVNMISQFREETGLAVEFSFPLSSGAYIEPAVDTEDWQQQLRQIIREGLHNVVQHAEATRAEVIIGVSAKSLVITLKDNGKGMSAKEISLVEQSDSHLGIRNMRSRARLLGGVLKIFSQPGKGTRLVISIPLNRK